jgi:hypothetical protein
VIDDSMAAFNSDSSNLSDQLFTKLIDAIGILEDEVFRGCVLRACTLHSHVPQLHLLDKWALNNDLCCFHQNLQVDPMVFDKLVELIEAHAIIGYNHPKSSLLFF